MRNPRDYLHAQIRIGSKVCEIVDGNNVAFMRSRGTSDMNAIKNLQTLIDEMILDKAKKDVV